MKLCGDDAEIIPFIANCVFPNDWHSKPTGRFNADINSLCT